MEDDMNPFHWTREHQLSWAIISGVGAVSGILMGFIYSPYFSLTQPWSIFWEWLSSPQHYWRWSLFSFLITGIIFYTAQLFRKSN
jgi:hypothetical protein